jgi:hypothetical protein
MKLFLTRQKNGLYMLTKYKPITRRVEGRDFSDAYVIPGEPIGVRNLCDAILNLIEDKPNLKRGESVLIDLNCSLVKFD